MKTIRLNLRLCSKLFIIFAGMCFLYLSVRHKLQFQRNYSGTQQPTRKTDSHKKGGLVTIADKEILSYLVPQNDVSASESDTCALDIVEGAFSTPYQYRNDIDWSTFSASLAKTLKISAGGEWQPDGCISRFLVAIIIPFQNRESNLREFLAYIHPFLQSQNIHYKIYVIELPPKSKWNRGILFNAGFIEVMKDKSFPCLILHDVDSLPTYRNNIYACTNGLRLMAVSRDPPFHKMHFAFDGVANAILSDNFKLVNGFSNRFFGWGKEDTDFKKRAMNKSLPIMRFAEKISHYRSLPHKKAKKNPQRLQNLEEGKLFYHEGLNTTRYDVICRIIEPLYTKIVISLPPETQPIK